MKPKERELLSEMRSMIADRITEGSLSIILADLGDELTLDDRQQIECDRNNRGVNWAMDTLIDCLLARDGNALRMFISCLKKLPQTEEILVEFKKQCSSYGLEYLLDARATVTRARPIGSGKSKRGIACKILLNLKPLVRENMTAGDLHDLRRKLAVELTLDDVQQVKALENQKGHLSAIDALIDRLASGSKKSYTIFIKYIQEHRNMKEVYDRINTEFKEQGLQALLPNRPVEQDDREEPETSKSEDTKKDVIIPAQPFIAQPCSEDPVGKKQSQDIVHLAGQMSETTLAEDKIGRYKMSSKPTGVCLIVSNKDFSATRHENGLNFQDRDGTDVDVVNLESIFEWFGFRVSILRDASAMELWNFLRSCKNENHSSQDCLVVCILTHGLRKNNKDMICGVDGKDIPLDNVFSIFDGENCPSLIGKPKLFFLQCCRGRSDDPGGVSKGTNQHDGPVSSSSSQLPILSDFFIGFATPPGYKSWRNSLTGSWYISKLCEVFKDMAREYHLMDMMTKVNSEVSKFYTDKGQMQVPNPSMTLTKRLYFAPVADSKGEE